MYDFENYIFYMVWGCIFGGVVKCRMTTSSTTSSSAAPSRIGMKFTVYAAYYYNAA
jgi:hypothetical protein